MAMAHPGFNAVAGKIAASENLPIKRAKAILAAKSRNASAKAKRKNPRLNRVKGDAENPVEGKTDNGEK